MFDPVKNRAVGGMINSRAALAHLDRSIRPWVGRNGRLRAVADAEFAAWEPLWDAIQFSSPRKSAWCRPGGEA